MISYKLTIWLSQNSPKREYVFKQDYHRIENVPIGDYFQAKIGGFMGLLRDRKYAKVGSNLIEVNLSTIFFAKNPLSLFLKGFFELELLVNNFTIKKERINLGTYKIKGVSRDLSSNNSLIVIVTVNVNPLKWESFEYKLEVNEQDYNLID